jgi:hypothetical protein
MPDGLTRINYKPRHGIRMTCEACGFRFNAGGVQTKKQLNQIEKEHKLVHQHIHKQVRKPTDPNEHNQTLKIERDSHSAEITHAHQELAGLNSQFATTSTTYVDTGLSVSAGSFTANRDHLVIATAQINMSANNATGFVRLMRGTTAIDDSEAGFDPPLSTSLAVDQRMVYNWWGIVNHTAAEAVKMQLRTSAGTAAVDLATITVIRLSPDLVLNTDYKYQLDSDPVSISVSSTTANDLGSDSATDNATVTITPSSNNHRWLILSKARYGVGLNALIAVNSRIERSGAVTSSVPEMEQEGESATNSIAILCGIDRKSVV